MRGRSGQDLPVVAVSIGDPAGIGPEIALAAAADGEVLSLARLLLVGDGALLEKRARRSRLPFELAAVASPEELKGRRPGAGYLADASPGPEEGVLGRVDPECGRASVEWIRRAAGFVIQGRAEALVTCPINKESLAAASLPYEGHTELLGELTGAEPVMMLVGGGLKVALLTRHVALKRVPGLVSTKGIVELGRVVAAALLRDFGVPDPHLGVLGLNPHASDGGRFGDEEGRLIAPAVGQLRREGVRASGPLVPDTAFLRAMKGEWDALLAMYHDQGLIALKTVAFETGVNVTLNLPIVRTSPAHGTAFDIAGKGAASARSLKEAIRLAVEVVNRRVSERRKK